MSRRLLGIILFVIVCSLLAFTAYAEDDDSCSECGYSDDDINIISNIVNGEVGGICGTVVLTYPDGTQLYADACVLHKIHAQVVDNQVNSSMFPDTVYGCAVQCWSSAYSKTGTRTSSQWQHCKEDAIEALSSYDRIPSNVFAATCDSRFAQKYRGFYLYARVDWNTGWVSGTFYYYSYGYYVEPEEDDSYDDYTDEPVEENYGDEYYISESLDCDYSLSDITYYEVSDNCLDNIEKYIFKRFYKFLIRTLDGVYIELE